MCMFHLHIISSYASLCKQSMQEFCMPEDEGRMSLCLDFGLLRTDDGYPLSSIRYLLSAIFHPLSAIFHPPSAIYSAKTLRSRQVALRCWRTERTVDR